MARETRKKIAPGIWRWSSGVWEVRVHVEGLPQYHKRLPATKTQRAVEEHVSAQRRGMRRLKDSPSLTGTLAADAKRYLGLESVKRMPTFQTRAYHIWCWVQALGEKRRHGVMDDDEQAISQRDVSVTLDAWQGAGLPRRPLLPGQTPPRGGRARAPLSDSYLNRLRTALGHLYSMLDEGRTGLKNPALAVARRAEPKAQPRGVLFAVIETILAQMPDRGRAAKGEPRKDRAVSWSKQRSTVVAFAGLRPEELMRILPLDWNEHAETLFVRAAKASQERTIPLLPQATAALKALKADGALWDTQGQPRRFSPSSVRKAWRRAWQKANAARARAGETPWPWIRPYDLRHSFLTETFVTTRDLEATRQMAGHADISMTRRYALAGVPVNVARAAADLRAKLAPLPSPVTATATPGNDKTSHIDR